MAPKAMLSKRRFSLTQSRSVPLASVIEASSVAAGHDARRPRLPSRPGEFHPEPLSGRVEDWRAGLGRSLYSLFLALSFASVTLSRPCQVSSPRHVERSVRISRTALSCLLHLKGYGTYRAGATFGISQRTL